MSHDADEAQQGLVDVLWFGVGVNLVPVGAQQAAGQVGDVDPRAELGLQQKQREARKQRKQERLELESEQGEARELRREEKNNWLYNKN
ncbi:MAG: hypothetical protein PVG14_20105 [Anaerolineales bacterium]|jgi:hypothetical protein